MPVARYEVEELRRLARRQGDTTWRAVAPESTNLSKQFEQRRCLLRRIIPISKCLENIAYRYFRQLWLVLGVKLMEINSNLFSRW